MAKWEPLKLVELDPGLCEAVKTAWCDQEIPEIVKVELTAVFARISGSGYKPLAESFNAAVFRALVDGGQVVAIIEFTPSRRGRDVWLKMNDIHLPPEEQDLHTISPDEQRRLHIFGSAVVGTMAVANSIPNTKSIKLYGRSNALLGFLESMAASERLGSIPGLSITIEGRWLVFEHKGD